MPRICILKIALSILFFGSLASCGGGQNTTNRNWALVKLVSKGIPVNDVVSETIEVRNCIIPEIKTTDCSAGTSNGLSVDVGGGIQFGEGFSGSIESNVSSSLGIGQQSGQSISLDPPPSGYIYAYKVNKTYSIINGEVLARSSNGEEQVANYVFNANCSITIVSREQINCTGSSGKASPTYETATESIPSTFATISVPEKSLEYLNNVQATYLDTLDDPARSEWYFDIGSITDGKLKIIGENWRGFSHAGSFAGNQGFIIDFTYTRSSQFDMAITNGIWDTDQRRQLEISIIDNEAKILGWEGKKYFTTGNLPGNLSLKPDQNYQLLTAILPNAEFIIVVWDFLDTSKTLFYRGKFGQDWSNLNWKFEVVANKGTILFDNYKEINFDSVK